MTGSISSSQFEAWVTANRRKLLRIAMSVLKNTDEAEDVVQDTLISVWRLTNQDAVKDLNAYAARAIWVNAVKRRSRRRETVSIDEHQLNIADTADQEKIEEASLTAIEVERALRNLPTAQQIVIRLRYYGDMSFREISNSLSISINTAASRYRYALKALKRALSSIQKETDYGKKQ